MIRRSIAIATLAVSLLAFGCSSTPSVDAVEGFRDWIASRRELVGLVVFDGADREPVIALNGDGRFPLASTRKVLILGAYAEQVAAGRLDPATRVPVAEIERWYWPGTDGGAHQRALDDWAERRRVSRGSVAVEDVVHAMIRWSDNAASDEVLQRVGGPAPVADYARRIGMRRQDPLMPILGEYAAWSTQTPDAWRALGPATRAERGAALALSTTKQDSASLAGPSIDDQRRFARSSPSGSPREWAELIRRLHAGTSGIRGASIVQRHLAWPLEAFTSNRERFDRFGAKGGRLAGVMTDVAYIRPKVQRPIAAALFLRDLPSEIEEQLGESFVQQRFLVRLAEDATFLRDTSEVLR